MIKFSNEVKIQLPLQYYMYICTLDMVQTGLYMDKPFAMNCGNKNNEEIFSVMKNNR